MSEQRIDPPIPLPEFDPYEQLGKARQRIAALEAGVARLRSELVAVATAGAQSETRAIAAETEASMTKAAMGRLNTMIEDQISRAETAEAKLAVIGELASFCEYEQHIAELKADCKILNDSNDELRASLNTAEVKLAAVIKDCAACFREAALDIDSWAAYASDYFQQKHDLKANVEDYRNKADELEALLKGERDG